MWISRGRPNEKKGAANAKALGREHVWHVRGTPRRPVLEQSEQIDYIREETGIKLCNPLFRTEVAGFYGTFVQTRKRYFLWTEAAAQVHGLGNEVCIVFQSQLDAYWHSKTCRARPCAFCCCYIRAVPPFKPQVNT